MTPSATQAAGEGSGVPATQAGLSSDDGAASVSTLRASIPDAASIQTLDEMSKALSLLARLDRELKAIRAEYQERKRQIQFELNSAGHPWLGKEVARTLMLRKKRSIFYRGPDEHVQKNERGTVVRQPPERASYRKHRPEPGEIFVLSHTGKTAYSLNDRAGWQLVSEPIT